jgi:hypothetical protein
MLNIDFETLYVINKICYLTNKIAHKIIANFPEHHWSSSLVWRQGCPVLTSVFAALLKLLKYNI